MYLVTLHFATLLFVKCCNEVKNHKKLSEQEITVNIALHVCKIYVNE